MEMSTAKGLRLGLGVLFGLLAGASLALAAQATGTQAAAGGAVKRPKVVYPEKTELDFEGTQIEGELRTPGEFYFQHREEEKFDSLVKRRKNFHKEMLRDVVLGK
jgi:hypothetical protein